MSGRVTWRTRRGLEDTDEDEEEGESAGSSNGKAVDAELELTDGVGDPSSRSSDDREVTRRRAFQAYERSHRIGPNLLVHGHAPVVVLLAVLDLGHPNVEPPQSTFKSPGRCLARRGSSSHSIATAWIAPVIRTSCSAPPSGGRVWWESRHVRSIARFLTDKRSDKDRVGEEVVFLRLERSGRLRYGKQPTGMVQMGDGATVIKARQTITGKRGARQPLAWVLFTTLSQTQRDLDTDRLNAQKARELLRRHPRPVGQARRVCAICERGLLDTEDAEASIAAAAADADLLLGSTDVSDGPFLPPDRTPSTAGTHNTGDDTASESALLQHSTALQEELAA
ncbi:hypothetical protein EDB83DRAFT_2314139 [Lactarius deliciosus]|nr:hypothetical protein EDB83DRAFT_2314139 [Lactarius deliciosus]